LNTDRASTVSLITWSSVKSVSVPGSVGGIPNLGVDA
jgi:hypothetical protein